MGTMKQRPSSRLPLALILALGAQLLSPAEAQRGRRAEAPAEAPRNERADDRPNILWLTAEDLSPNLGCYGDPYARTPTLDRLAAEGIRYTRAFATAPVCSPARSCLITGIHATSLGTQNLRSRFPIPESVKGFPSYLRAAGYYCTNNVKTDYNTSRESELIAESWDSSSATAHWRGRKPVQPFFSVFNDMTTHQSRTMVWPHEQFVREVRSHLDHGEVHDPASAPVPPWYPDTPIVRRTIARYHDCITAMDRNVARILSELDADGLAESTIVWFFGDHGAGLPRHKRLVLDSGLRVPLIVRFPAKYRRLAPAGRRGTVGRLVGFADFPPTVLSLAGLPAPAAMEGNAFLGRGAARAPRPYVHGARDRVDEAYDLARSVRDERFLYVRNFFPHLSYNQPSFFSDQGEIRREITRLAAEGALAGPQLHYAGPRRALEELYDAEADPLQVRNLAGDPAHREALARLRAELRRWILETRDTGFLPESDLARRCAGSTPYDMRTEEARYPLERILPAAELVGAGPAARDEQVRLLGDSDPAVRYWGAVGLRDLGADARPAAAVLEKAIDDPSPPVRIEAAAVLVSLGEHPRAIEVLAKDLEGCASGGGGGGGGGDLDAALRAARALQLLGERARTALPAMRRILALAASREDDPVDGDPWMFLRFTLEPAVGALEKPAKPTEARATDAGAMDAEPAKAAPAETDEGTGER